MSKINSFKFLVSTDNFGQYLDTYSNDLILIMDEQENIIWCNGQFITAIGYSFEEIEGLPVSAIIQWTDPMVTLYESFASAQAEGLTPPEIKVMNKHGQQHAYKVHISPIEIQSGPGFLLLFRNNRRKELSLLQQFSDTFLKDVNLGVILIDTEYILIDISDMACRVLGLQRESILNKSMEEVFASVPIEHRLVQRTILDGMMVRNYAISWMNNQDRYELLMDSNVLRDNGGRIVGAYIIFKDVSNLRSLEEQVQRSDRLAMIGQIAAGTAHEIRNPLTSIKGFLQVLRKSFETQGLEKEQGYTEVMLSEINRINELVNEFLLLSKPKNITFEQIDISGVLRGLLPIINNEAILHKVYLQYEAVHQLPLVIADQELLKQVFLNICKNGIEAMIEGGTLTITEKMDLEEHKVNIEIHDSGPGIPLFVIDKIFDPFFTTKDNGTGLGLSVCQRIIHDMGGLIRVSSKGFGTTFTVSIPFP